ncbi:MAG: PAS domain S-box protein [Candidatus Zixiibacteriota bacterium]
MSRSKVVSTGLEKHSGGEQRNLCERAILELASDAILVVEIKTGRIIDASGSACEMFGYSLVDICQMNISDLSAESSDGERDSNLSWMTSLSNDQHLEAHWRVKTGSGLQLTMDLDARSALLDGRNCLIVKLNQSDCEVIPTSPDLERADDLAALNQSQNDMIYFHAADGTLTMYNNAHIKMTGYSPSEFEKYPELLKSLVQSDETKFSADIQITGQNSDPVTHLVYQLKTKAGKWKCLQSQRIAVIDEQGKFKGFNCIDRDITEFKGNGKVLPDSEARYQEMFNAIREGIVVLDKDENVEFANQACAEIFGVDTVDCLVGNDLMQFIPEEEKSHACSQQDLRQQEGIKTDYELSIVTSNGLRKILRVSMSPRLDKKGNYSGAMGSFQDITDQKQAEMALKNSEAKYRTYISNAPHGVFVLDEKGQFSEINEQFCRLSGYPEYEVIGHIPPKFFSPHKADAARQEFCKLFSEGRFDGDIMIRRYDGTDATFRVTVVRLTDGRFFGFIADITDRVNAEEALRKSEHKYKTYLSSAPFGVFVINGEGVFLEANETASRFSGYTIEEMTGMRLERLIPKKNPAGFEHFRQLLERSQSSGEVLVKHKNGSFHWYQVDAVKLSEDRYIGYCNDVTDRRLADEEIRKFKSIADGATYGIAICDLDGTLTYVNKCIAQMHGYDMENLLTCDVSIFHTIDQIIEVRRMLNDLKRKGSFTSREVWHKHRDETVFPTLMNGTIIRDDEGEPKFMAMTASDITELKHLQEFAGRAERLETAGRIAGQVAHDFNNLLGPLVGYPDLIRDELADGNDALPYLEAMETAARQIADINQQLLSLGRRGHYNLESLKLNDIIESVLKSLHPIPPNVVVKTNLSSDLKCIKGGSSQIFRVIVNLIANALDAMADNGVLTISTEGSYVENDSGKYNQIPVGEYVKLTIKDTGRGIPGHELLRVFEPFFTTKHADKKHGSGLGLSVVDAVVKDMAALSIWKAMKERAQTYTYIFQSLRKMLQCRKRKKSKKVQRVSWLSTMMECNDRSYLNS